MVGTDTDRRGFMGKLAAGIPFAALAGCTTSGDDPGEGGSTGGGERDLVVLNEEPYVESYSAGVRGTVKNQTDRDYDYVQIEVSFYDSSGAKVGDGLDNTGGLAAGQRWRFDAMYMGTNTEVLDTYSIDELTGY